MWRGRKDRRIAIKLKKNYRHRHFVIKELIATELSYMSDLLIIKECILASMIESKIVSDNYVKIFSSNLGDILKIHKEMQVRLQ